MDRRERGDGLCVQRPQLLRITGQLLEIEQWFAWQAFHHIEGPADPAFVRLGPQYPRCRNGVRSRKSAKGQRLLTHIHSGDRRLEPGLDSEDVLHAPFETV